MEQDIFILREIKGGTLASWSSWSIYGGGVFCRKILAVAVK